MCEGDPCTRGYLQPEPMRIALSAFCTYEPRLHFGLRHSAGHLHCPAWSLSVHSQLTPWSTLLLTTRARAIITVVVAAVVNANRNVCLCRHCDLLSLKLSPARCSLNSLSPARQLLQPPSPLTATCCLHHHSPESPSSNITSFHPWKSTLLNRAFHDRCHAPCDRIRPARLKPRPHRLKIGPQM